MRRLQHLLTEATSQKSNLHPSQGEKECAACLLMIKHYLKETSSEFTPENGWLEYDRFLFGRSIFRRAAGLNLQQKHRFFPNKHAAHHLGPSFDIDFVIVSSNTVFLISQFGY